MIVTFISSSAIWGTGSDTGSVASRAKGELTRSKCDWTRIWTIYNVDETSHSKAKQASSFADSSTASKSCKQQLEVHFRLQNWYHIVVIVVYNNEKKENLIQSWVTWCKQTAENHFFWFAYNHFKIGLCPKLCYHILWRIQPRYNTVDSQLCTKMYKKSKYWQNMLNML